MRAPHPSLEILRRQYLALYPIYLLSLPAPSILASDAAQAFLSAHLLGDPSYSSKESGVGGGRREGVWRGPDEGYQRKAWKKIVDTLEIGVGERIDTGDDEAVVDERFYEHLAGLMVSSTNDLEPKPSFRTFVYDIPSSESSSPENRQETLTLLEDQITIQGGTTGLRTWTAALELAHHILHHPSALCRYVPLGDHSSSSHPPTGSRSRGIIELGAGTGLVSVILAQMGVDVVATDLGDGDNQEVDDEEGASGMDGVVRTPLGRLQYNIALNNCPSKPVVQHLDWFDANKPPADRPAIWAQLLEDRRDIVAADVYDPYLVPPLVDAIDVLLGDGPDGRVALISATVRNQETFDKFTRTCRQHGLALEMLDLLPMDPAAPTFWDSALDAGATICLMRITKP